MRSFISIDNARAIFSKVGLQIVGDKPIDSGGFKVVFEATDDETNNRYALKVLNPDKTDHNRLNREARAMIVNVSSPYVGKLVRKGNGDDTEDYPYLLEEFIDGETLQSTLERIGHYDPQQGLKLLKQIFQGLLACAENNIVHRDIKPKNIMIRRDDGTPVLIDFGISRHLDLDSLTTTGRPGPGLTWQYAPPEMLDAQNYNRKNIRETSDLFSMGIVAYEMFTGIHPFLKFIVGEDLLERMLNAEATPPHELESSIPLPLSNFIMKLLRRKIHTRYPSVKFALQKLNEIS